MFVGENERLTQTENKQRMSEWTQCGLSRSVLRCYFTTSMSACVTSTAYTTGRTPLMSDFVFTSQKAAGSETLLHLGMSADSDHTTHRTFHRHIVLRIEAEALRDEILQTLQIYPNQTKLQSKLRIVSEQS